MSLRTSILLSTALRPVGMFISIIYTPLLLSYLGQEQYGIWVTILSVINWINYFDVGIGNGYRNKLTDALENNDDGSVAALTRTAYMLLAGVVGIVFVVGMILVLSLDVNAFFNTDLSIKAVLGVSLAFVCINFVAALCKPQLFALQHAELVSLMAVSVNGLTLLFIASLNACLPRSMLLVAISVGMAGLITNIVFSAISWKSHKGLRPSRGPLDRANVMSICFLGVKFFLVQISALILYTTDNLIIMGCLGAASVTAYSTTYNAFGAVGSLATAALSPMWSKVTQTAANGDFSWIMKALKKSLLAMVPFALVFGVLAFAFKPIAKIWLGTELNYVPGLIPCMAIYYTLFLIGSVLSSIANGLGRTRVQLITGLAGAVINIPLSVFLCLVVKLDATGVLLATILTMAVSNVAVCVDLAMFLKTKMHGASAEVGA